jgi:hypothetical protein
MSHTPEQEKDEVTEQANRSYDDFRDGRGALRSCVSRRRISTRSDQQDADSAIHPSDATSTRSTTSPRHGVIQRQIVQTWLETFLAMASEAHLRPLPRHVVEEFAVALLVRSAWARHAQRGARVRPQQNPWTESCPVFPHANER